MEDYWAMSPGAVADGYLTVSARYDAAVFLVVWPMEHHGPDCLERHMGCGRISSFHAPQEENASLEIALRNLK